MIQMNGKVKDPVCGMVFDPKFSVATQEWQGTLYNFCSGGCGGKFKAHPQQYVPATQAPTSRGCCANRLDLKGSTQQDDL